MRPLFRGTFVGQRWSRPGTTAGRRVAWHDRESGELRFGRRQGAVQPTEELMWDGEEWVTPSEFSTRMRVRLRGRP